MATYTAASVALNCVPDMTGFFAELDARIRGYSPPPIPGPDTGPPDTSDTEEGLEDSARSGGLAAAAVAAGVLIGAALSSAIGSALDMSSAQSRLAAQLGDQNMIGAERAGKVAANLYAGAWGSSLGEVSDAVSMVIRSGAVAADATDEQIQGVTASVLDLAAAFDVDTVQATAALSAMVRNNLVPNAEAGLDVITRLYQTLGPGAEDVLDTFEEYSSQFAKVGIDAQIAGGLIAQMMEGGARSTDIAADAIKEFSIRSIDGSKTTIEAYSAIGVNADEMRRRIAAGGPDAQVAMSQVVAALQGVEDPAVRAEAAVGLFGTQAEDLGNALFAMDPENAVATLGDVEGAATRMGTTLNDNATVKITEFQRGLEVGVAGIINENVIPAVEGFLTAMDGFLSIPGVPDVLGFIFSAGAGIAITLGTIAAVTRAWTIAQAAFNIVMGLSPLTIVIVTLAALAGMMVYAYNTSEDFRVIVDGVFAWVGEAAGRLSAAWSTTMTSMGAILGWFQDAVGRFGAAWDQTMRSFADIVGWAGGVVDSVFAWIGGSATRFSESWAQTTDSISRMFRAVGDGFVWVYDNIIKPMFDGFLRFVGDVVHGLGIAWGALKEAFMAPVRVVVDVVWNQGIGGIWNSAKGLGIPLGDFPVVKFATGGRVPGRRGRKDADDVPALLTADEYVQPRDAVDYYGMGTMEALRKRRIPRDGLAALQSGEYIDGGDHDGPGARKSGFGGVKPHVAMAGHHLMRKYGISSVGGVGQRANASDHPKGLALDFMVRDSRGTQLANEVMAQANHYATKYAIWRQQINKGNGWARMENRGNDTANHFDHVHVSFHGDPNAAARGNRSGGGSFDDMESTSWLEDLLSGAFDGLANGVRSMVGAVAPRTGNFIGDMPMDFTDWGIAKTREFLFGKAKEEDSKGAGGGDMGGSGVARWSNIVSSALQMLGQPQTLVATTLRRMNQESGGNPRAINNWDSNAKRGTPSKGLMQVIDPTFRAHRDPRAPNDIWDPMANILASMRYALSRYGGSLSRAYDRKGGYDAGGALMPGITQVHNGLGHSETVIPLPPDLVNNLLRQGGGGPAVAIANATFADPVDVDVLMQRASYLVQAGRM